MTLRLQRAAILGVVALWAAVVVVLADNDPQTATVTAQVTITDDTGATLPNHVSQFPLSTQGLLDALVLNSDTLNAALCDSSAFDEGSVGECSDLDDIPMMPSPTRTRMEGVLSDNGGSFTDFTAAANNSTVNDVTVFPSDPTDPADGLYFVADTAFRILWIDVGTVTTSTVSVVWEYYDGDSYEAVPNLSDGTNAFRTGGLVPVTWDAPQDMAEVTPSTTTTGFTVRVRTTEVVSPGTFPLLTQAWYEPGVWRVFSTSMAAKFTGEPLAGIPAAAVAMLVLAPMGIIPLAMIAVIGFMAVASVFFMIALKRAS